MNRLFKVSTAICLLFATSCVKEPLQNPSSVNIQTNDDASQKTAGHYIGERFGGGIIFLMNATGTRGLIADTVDLPRATWWNGTDTTTGATGRAIGTGPANTRKIILSQGAIGRYAALECARSIRSGYTDWFLPSKNELNELYKQKNVVGGFIFSYYWSSSEYSNGNAWVVYFTFGQQTNDNKSTTNSVRAVRAF